ncbi:MAG: hypothetical protein U0W24_00760 [Bacteroidales bacterium]
MKSKLFLMLIVISIAFAACQKDNMMDNALGVDVKSYETQLKQDYTYALEYHNALGTSKSLTDDHAAHHSSNGNGGLTDSAYNRMMFHANDSLFAEHFYKFCKDMMQNSGMMTGTGGMMGSNSNMMGSGGMMNGSTMGGEMDMNKMMGYMDSLHVSMQNMMNPNFQMHDSLLYSQMSMCKMMTSGTDGIEQNYTNMQQLRKNHQNLHRN